MKTAIIDGCSLMYASGWAEHMKEAEFILNNYIQDIKEACNTDKIIGFTEAPEGKNILRGHIAVTRQYKEARKGRDKPQFVKEMKRVAKAKYGFRYTYWVEAEDALLITANTLGVDNVIMCSVDKDTRQQWGVFYDYFKKEFVTVTPEQAQYNYYKQLCQGDNCDSIVSIPGVGAKGAEKILDGVPVDEYPVVVAKAYKERGLTYEYLLENARLLYILRSRTDKPFTPLTREQWNEI